VARASQSLGAGTTHSITDPGRKVREVPSHEHRPDRLGQREEHQIIWIRPLQRPGLGFRPMKSDLEQPLGAMRERDLWA